MIDRFKSEIFDIFNKYDYLLSISWTQHTSTDDGFTFVISNIEINNNPIPYNKIKKSVYNEVKSLLDRYNGDFFFNNFGDNSKITFNKNNLIIIEDNYVL